MQYVPGGGDDMDVWQCEMENDMGLQCLHDALPTGDFCEAHEVVQ